MNSTTKSKYKNLNFNLKNTILCHLPLIQILRPIINIDRSTLIALGKNHVFNFINNNFEKLNELFLKFEEESIYHVKNLCKPIQN